MSEWRCHDGEHAPSCPRAGADPSIAELERAVILAAIKAVEIEGEPDDASRDDLFAAVRLLLKAREK